jgi:hypothetical protein
VLTRSPQEAKETEVTLLDDDPDAVEAFIRSLYNFELEDFGESTSPSMIDKANFYCNVVVVADKYGAEDLIEEASENLGLHLDDATPADLLASLELITEEYGRYERLKLCASEKVFLRLDELIPLNGFPTWLASQPILFKTFMGQASLYRTLERQGHYKCSACKRELVGSMDHSAPQCCRKAPVFMGKALSPLIISARGGVRGGDQRRPDIR